MQSRESLYFCEALPTKPDPGMGKILVTGATGYIGGRLVPELINRGYQVRIMVRSESPGIRERWPDAYPREHELAIQLHQLNPPPKFTSSYCLHTFKKESALFDSFCHIGCKMGWFNSNWMWRLRGLMDRLLMGVGSSRGRRSYKDLRAGDVIDFWRVENIVKINCFYCGRK
ncbi:MAG: DUF2867 domain-containing protein [Bacteroidota bacterium]|nr:DUF2867 domain-containing protein [Bacteroidota bacterium]